MVRSEIKVATFDRFDTSRVVSRFATSLLASSKAKVTNNMYNMYIKGNECEESAD